MRGGIEGGEGRGGSEGGEGDILVCMQAYLNVCLYTHCATCVRLCMHHSQAMYRLMSVVSHKGDTSSGHYISDVYSVKEGSWLSCNDSSTTKVH